MARGRSESEFWKWFLENELDLFGFEADQDRILGNLAAKLRRIHPDLSFEFGPVLEGRREFIISANGRFNAFSTVTSLVNSAPDVSRWNIIAFRPRKGTEHSIEINDVVVNGHDVYFDLERENNKLRVTLYLADMKTFDKKIHPMIGLLFLDAALGEYDVVTKIGSINFAPSDAETASRHTPFVRLPEMFDANFPSTSH